MPASVRRYRGPEIAVLRIGHRPGRDPRLTTHVALTARALGASRLYLHPPDPDLSERVAGVARRWGGSFVVTGAPAWKPVVDEYRGGVVHLTMYGEPFEQALPKLRRRRRLLLVVGGAKVPPALYEAADFNVAVGSQPHSEVAAVAVMLHRLKGRPPAGHFAHAQQRIVPQRRGKRVIGPSRGPAQ